MPNTHTLDDGTVITLHIAEIDGSIPDFLSQIRAAFNTRFNPGSDQEGDKYVPSKFLIKDVYEESVIARERDSEQLYRAGMTRSEAGITFDPRTKWQKVRLSYVAEIDGGEASGDSPDSDGDAVTVNWIQETTGVIGEFRGNFPEVPTPGVDMAALTKGDDDPFFVTLPVAQVGKVSKNKLLYDEPLVDSIVEQINQNKPNGIMGHLRSDQAASAFPEPDVYWLGAVKQDGKAWAKGYVPEGRGRNFLRRQKAKNGKAATSIWGPPPEQRIPVPSAPVGAWGMRGFELQSLDLAPYERAALKLGGDFLVTAEMTDSEVGAAPVETQTETTTEVQHMDKAQIIAELTASDANALPEAVRAAVIEQHQASNEQAARVAELEQVNETLTQERETATTQIAELQGQIVEFRRQQFAGQVTTAVAELTADWQVSGDEGQARLGALHRNFTRAVLAEMATNPEQALDSERLKTVVQELWDGEFKVLAESIRDSLAGPGALVGGSDGRSTDPLQVYLDKYGSPEALAHAQAKLGV